MSILLILAVAALVCAAIAAAIIHAAPEGWQDANGFHFGRKPQFPFTSHGEANNRD